MAETTAITKTGDCDGCGLFAGLRHTGARWLCASCWKGKVGK